jgi:uncharacterized protein DUF3105
MPKTERPDKDKRRSGTRASRRRLKVGASVAAVMVVAAVVGYFAYQAAPGEPGTKLADQGNRHIPTASDPHEAYNSDPPTSGPHLPYIAPWGVHTRPVPRELQVHNLEDGGVVIQYNCECPELVDKLKGIVRKHATQVLLAPYPDMKAKIALTAWTRLETLDDFDEQRINRFIQAYRGIDHHK